MNTKIIHTLLLYICSTFLGNIFSQNFSLDIRGKDSVENNILHNLYYKKSFSDYSSLSKEIDSTISTIIKKGYINAELKSLEKISDSSYLATLFLHNNYDKIRITNPEVLYAAGLQKKNLFSWINSEQNEILEFPFEDIEVILKALHLQIIETGDPFAVIRLTDIIPDAEETNVLNAKIDLYHTDKRIVTDIVVKGYEKFPKSFLKHTFGIKKGMLFQYQNIINKSVLIDHLAFAKNIKSPEVLFKEDETVLYLYIEKRKANNFDGILGFATEESTGKLTLNGYVNLALINNLNFGEKLSLEYRNDGQLQEEFDVQTELPFLFNTPFGVEAGLNLFKLDSSYITIKNHIYLNYKINYRTKVFAGYKTQKSENLLNQDNTTLLLSDYNIKAAVLGAGYEITQPGILFPLKTSILFSAEAGEKSIFQKKSPHYVGNFKAAHIFNLNSLNSIFTESISSYLSSENVLENELIRFGGIKSIRGFDENSLTATFYTVLRTEYRYLISNNSYVHTIADLAYMQSSITNTDHQLYSFGIGLGQYTRAGILQLNIANGKTDGQNFKFSNTKIHLSLRATF